MLYGVIIAQVRPQCQKIEKTQGTLYGLKRQLPGGIIKLGAEIVAIHSLPQSWGTGLGHAMLTEALKQIGEGTVFLWAFRENKRARRFYEKHGFRWDGTERISEFDGAAEVRYVRN